MADKKKRQTWWLAAGFALLAVIILILAGLNRRDDLPDSGSLALKAGDDEIAVYTMEEVQVLPYIEVEKEIVSSSYANDFGLFRGVPVRELWADAGAEPADYRQMVVTSEDGFVAVFPVAEVLDSDSVMLIYAKNGEPLGSMNDGGVGPFRILVVDDEFGNRCAKYVSELALK